MRPIRLGIQRRKKIKRFLTREEIENTELRTDRARVTSRYN